MKILTRLLATFASPAAEAADAPEVVPHQHRYSDGEDYPEHCRACGIDIRDDEAYQESALVHLYENTARAARGLETHWAVDQSAIRRASTAVRARARVRIDRLKATGLVEEP